MRGAQLMLRRHLRETLESPAKSRALQQTVYCIDTEYRRLVRERDPELRRRCNYLYGDVLDRVGHDVHDDAVVGALLEHLMQLFCRFFRGGMSVPCFVEAGVFEL